MDVAIIDYGMGNLLSVQRAFEKCRADVFVVENPLDLKKADRIVLPGVGAFPDAMNNLKNGNWIDELSEAVLIQKKPLLGICLGMQLLASKGNEITQCDGLDFISGEICKLESSDKSERIPHVGWNDIDVINDNGIFESIDSGTNFYFVHSYCFKPISKDYIGSVTNYCGGFVSAVVRDNIVGTQFHPEKSQKSGFKLIKNFLKM